MSKIMHSCSVLMRDFSNANPISPNILKTRKLTFCVKFSFNLFVSLFSLLDLEMKIFVLGIVLVGVSDFG